MISYPQHIKRQVDARAPAPPPQGGRACPARLTWWSCACPPTAAGCRLPAAHTCRRTKRNGSLKQQGATHALCTGFIITSTPLTQKTVGCLAQYHSTTVSRHHSIMAPQYHGTTVSRHHSTTAHPFRWTPYDLMPKYTAAARSTTPMGGWSKAVVIGYSSSRHPSMTPRCFSSCITSAWWWWWWSLDIMKSTHRA